MADPCSRLVIHADDFGETVEITHGIRQAIEAGRVTSTTILAHMPGTELALREAVRLAGRASFGVHLNLCEGRPLENVPSLVDAGGGFHPKRTQALRALAGRLDLNEVERELRAQIARVRDGGVKISHLDSHKHLHQLPGVVEVVSRLAREFGIERIRCTVENGTWPSGMGASAWVGRSVRVALARRARRRFRQAGLRHPGRVFDVRELMARRGELSRLTLLRRPQELTEMICHPGTERADLDKPGSCDRHGELRFLLSEEFRELVDRAPADLRTYWEC